MKTQALSLLAGAMLALGSAASHGAALISAGSATVAAGTPTVTVSVDATGFPTNTAGGGLTVSWDTNIITLSPADPASGVAYDPMWDQSWNVIVTHSPGAVTNATFLPLGFFNPTYPGTGANFHLMDLTFDVVGEGTSAINVSVPTLNGWYDLIPLSPEIAVATANGSVTVSPAAPPVPLPPAVWLLMSGLTGLFAVARRRQAA